MCQNPFQAVCDSDHSITKAPEKVATTAMNGTISSSVSGEEGEGKEQDDGMMKLQLVLRTLQQLTRIASMDPSEYHDCLTQKSQQPMTLVEDLAFCYQDHSIDEATSTTCGIGLLHPVSVEAHDAYSYLLHETSIPRLECAIQQLLSNLFAIRDEYDSLQNDMNHIQKYNEKLSHAIQTMHQRNRRLNLKLQKEQHKSTILRKELQATQQNLHDAKLEQERLVDNNNEYRMYTHEQFLTIQRLEKQKSFVDPTICCKNEAGNRPRTSSSSTISSDGENSSAMLHDELDLIDSTLRPWRELPRRTYRKGSYSDGGDTDSLSTSGSSGVSLVTDYGVATVRLATNENTIRKDPSVMEKVSPSFPTPEMCSTYTFSRGKELGLELQAVPLAHVEPDPKTNPGQKTATVRRTAPSNSKKLKSTTHDSISLLNETFLEDNNPHRNSGDTGQAIVISGCNNDVFDTSLNPKPPAKGARLIAINSEVIDNSWTLEKAMEKLFQFMQPISGAQDSTYTITFTNDSLTEKQDEALQTELQAGTTNDVKLVLDKRVHSELSLDNAHDTSISHSHNDAKAKKPSCCSSSRPSTRFRFLKFGKNKNQAGSTSNRTLEQ